MEFHPAQLGFLALILISIKAIRAATWGKFAAMWFVAILFDLLTTFYAIYRENWLWTIEGDPRITEFARYFGLQDPFSVIVPLNISIIALFIIFGILIDATASSSKNKDVSLWYFSKLSSSALKFAIIFWSISHFHAALLNFIYA